MAFIGWFIEVKVVHWGLVLCLNKETDFFCSIQPHHQYTNVFNALTSADEHFRIQRQARTKPWNQSFKLEVGSWKLPFLLVVRFFCTVLYEVLRQCETKTIWQKNCETTIFSCFFARDQWAALISRYSFFNRRFLKEKNGRVSNLWPRGLESPWTGSQVSSLRRNASPQSSNMRSQSFSNCLVKVSVAALIWRATCSDVMGVLKLVAALLTSLISFPSKLWVSSPVELVFASSIFGPLNLKGYRGLK